MTFDKAAWAIDGPTTKAALARLAEYVATGGAEGIVDKTDFKVTPTSPLTRGITISAGGGLIRNRYQGSEVNQTYAVSNSGDHTISSGSMPAVSASAQEFLVLVTVGDEEFSQVGHPWMTGSPIETPDTFQYVRPIVYGPVSAGATVASLNLSFPALAIARLNIPANATNITAEMITDLRTLARPRSQTIVRRIISGGPVFPNNSGEAASALRPLLNWVPVQIPDWANVAKVFGTIDGVKITGFGRWVLRPMVSDANVTPVGSHLFTYGLAETSIDWASLAPTAMRLSIGFGESVNISTGIGRTLYFGLMAQSVSGFDDQVNNLQIDQFSSVTMTILLEEQPS